MTSFSRLHLSRSYSSRRLLEQINLHFMAVYTRWLIREAKKMWTAFESFCRNGKFHVWRHAFRRDVDGTIAAFLSSVSYFFGDLLKSANMSFVRHEHSLFHDLIVYYHHCTVYYETVTGEEILKSNVASLWHVSSRVRQIRPLQTTTVGRHSRT